MKIQVEEKIIESNSLLMLNALKLFREQKKIRLEELLKDYNNYKYTWKDPEMMKIAISMAIEFHQSLEKHDIKY